MTSVPGEQLANVNGGYTPSPEAMAWLQKMLVEKGRLSVVVLDAKSSLQVVPRSGRIVP